MSAPKQNTDVRSQIIQNLHTYHQAMLDVELDKLAQLITDDYSLVPITGETQTKAEMLEIIGTGNLVYHQIEVEPDSLKVELLHDSASLTGIGTFNATLHGMQYPWHLRFTIQFVRQAPHWLLQHSVYTRP